MRTLNSVLISLLLAIPCTAATIIVDANGTGDYPTIQATINAGRTSVRAIDINDSLRIDSNETG